MSRNGDGLPMIPVTSYRDMTRRVWRRYSLGEMSAITGLATSTIRKVMWGDSSSIQQLTAVKLQALRPMDPGEQA